MCFLCVVLRFRVIYKIRQMNDPLTLSKKPLNELLKSGLTAVNGSQKSAAFISFEAALANRTLLLFFDGEVEGELLSSEHRKNRLTVIKAVNAMTRQLQEIGRPLAPEFEVVFVPSTKPYDAESMEELQQLSWAATTGLNPTGYSRRLALALRKKYSVPDNQVQMISLDSNHNVVSDNAFPLLFADPSRMPWHKEHVHSLLSEVVLKDRHNRTVNFADVVASGKNIGLFFGAGWHDKNDEYLPKLISLYNEVNSQHARGTGKGLEIIYVGSDGSVEDYAKQQAKMPWLAVAPEEETRRDLLRIGVGLSAIPTLLVLDSEGKMLNENAMLRILGNSSFDGFPWPEKPTYDLNEGATPGNATVAGHPGWVATKLARGTTVLLFVEGTPVAKQRELLTALEDVAKSYYPPAGPLMLFGNSNEKRGRDVHFVSSRQPSRLSQALRNICGLKPLAAEPTLVVLQLNKGRFYKQPLGATISSAAFKEQARGVLEKLDSLKFEYIKLGGPVGAQGRPSSPLKRAASVPPVPPSA